MDSIDLANAAVAEYECLVRQLLLERQARADSAGSTSVAPGTMARRGWIPRLGRFVSHQ